MVNKLAQVIVLALLFFGGSAWGQSDEQKIVIEPEHPASNDLITISITNSTCYWFSQVNQEEQKIFIRLTIDVSICQEGGNQETDFETTIGPLEVGEYMVVYSQSFGLAPRVADRASFSVVEAPPVSALSDGGINGLYYNPEADGHYLYILETDFTTLVIWTTFDSDGNQVWVWGTGELIHGRSVIADTYINRNEGHSPDGEITASEAEHWGRIEVDMTSCTEGLVSFYSDMPEFGNGQFPIERLAYVKQLDCIEID